MIILVHYDQKYFHIHLTSSKTQELMIMLMHYDKRYFDSHLT